MTGTQKTVVVRAAAEYRFGKVPAMIGWTKEMKKFFIALTSESRILISRDTTRGWQ